MFVAYFFLLLRLCNQNVLLTDYHNSRKTYWDISEKKKKKKMGAEGMEFLGILKKEHV